MNKQQIPILEKVLLYLLEVALIPVNFLPKSMQFKIAWPLVATLSGLSHFVENYKALAMVETGDWTSQRFQATNNPWGMKVPSIRKSWGIIGEWQTGEASAKYRSVVAACIDMIYRHKYFQIDDEAGSSTGKFLAELIRTKYFQADPTTYLQGLVSALERDKKNGFLNLVLSVTGFVLVGTALYGLYLLGIKAKQKWL